MIAVVTNIDADHLGTLRAATSSGSSRSFVEFLHNLPFYGLAVLCSDDANARELIPQIGRPRRELWLRRARRRPRVRRRAAGAALAFQGAATERREPLTVELNLAGRAQRAQLARGDRRGTRSSRSPTRRSQRALGEFPGHRPPPAVLRRRRRRRPGASRSSTTTATTRPRSRRRLRGRARRWPGRRLVLVFQPHRYTRTRDLLDEFAQVLADVDALLVTEVYPAGEAPIAGADGKSLCRAVRARGRSSRSSRGARRAAGSARRDPARRRRRAHAWAPAASARPRRPCRERSPRARRSGCRNERVAA